MVRRLFATHSLVELSAWANKGIFVTLALSFVLAVARVLPLLARFRTLKVSKILPISIPIYNRAHFLVELLDRVVYNLGVAAIADAPIRAIGAVTGEPSALP